jgi:hypothetical protein
MGREILIMGGMNFIEREMDGLRLDIALIESKASRKEIHAYAGAPDACAGQSPRGAPGA